SEPLEVVLGEVPKEASRVVITDRLSGEVEALLERHLRRASRQGVATEGAASAELPIRYVTTTASGRGAALRRLLDDLDPPSVVVLASDDEAADSARAAIAALGLDSDAGVRVETTPIDEAAALVILYDLPSDSSSIARLAAAPPAQAVA